MAGHCCTNKQRTISLRRANHLNKTIRGLFYRQYFTLLDYTQLTEGSTTKQHSSIYYLQLDSPTQSHSLQDQEGSMGWMGEGIGRDERYRSDYVIGERSAERGFVIHSSSSSFLGRSDHFVVVIISYISFQRVALFFALYQVH